MVIRKIPRKEVPVDEGKNPSGSGWWNRMQKLLLDHPSLLFVILALGIPLAVSLALGVVALVFFFIVG